MSKLSLELNIITKPYVFPKNFAPGDQSTLLIKLKSRVTSLQKIFRFALIQ